MTVPHVVITYPFPLGMKNGGSRMTLEIARHVARAGAEVTIVALSATPMTAFPRPAVSAEILGLDRDEELARDSVTIVRVDQHPLHWALDARRVRDAVARVLDDKPADLVLGYYSEAAALPDLLRSRGVAFGFISTWQSYAKALRAKAQGVRGLPRRWLNQRLIVRPYRRGELFFATSEFTKRELIDVLGVDVSRIVICPLGVDNAFLDLPRPRPEKIEHLLFFGRLTPGKGVFDAIEALAMLRQRGLRGWTFRMFGPGDAESVRAAARDAGIADQVEVRGAIGDAELREMLQWAHVAVLPSRFEAFGLAFAESQAAGLPVIGFEAGSVPEVVQNGVSGWLGPIRDIDALADNLAEAMRDPEATHRAGIAGRERVARIYRWENTAATILGAINDPGTAPREPRVTASSGAGRSS